LAFYVFDEVDDEFQNYGAISKEAVRLERVRSGTSQQRAATAAASNGAKSLYRTQQQQV
jgi:hypothetical protein